MKYLVPISSIPSFRVFSCLFGIMPDPLEGLIETLCIEIKYSNRSILLTSVYRPPNNDSDSIQHWLSNMEESM